jgi:hypothetical protein
MVMSFLSLSHQYKQVRLGQSGGRRALSKEVRLSLQKKALVPHDDCVLCDLTTEEFRGQR